MDLEEGQSGSRLKYFTHFKKIRIFALVNNHRRTVYLLAPYAFLSWQCKSYDYFAVNPHVHLCDFESLSVSATEVCVYVCYDNIFFPNNDPDFML